MHIVDKTPKSVLLELAEMTELEREPEPKREPEPEIPVAAKTPRSKPKAEPVKAVEAWRTPPQRRILSAEKRMAERTRDSGQRVLESMERLVFLAEAEAKAAEEYAVRCQLALKIFREQVVGNPKDQNNSFTVES